MNAVARLVNNKVETSNNPRRNNPSRATSLSRDKPDARDLDQAQSDQSSDVRIRSKLNDLVVQLRNDREVSVSVNLSSEKHEDQFVRSHLQQERNAATFE